MGIALKRVRVQAEPADMTSLLPDRDPPALAEWEVYAEHRAALDATLFASATPDLVLELHQGQLAAQDE